MTLASLVYWLRQQRYLSVWALVGHFSIMPILNSFNLIFYTNITSPNSFFVCQFSLAMQGSLQLAHMLLWSSKGTAGVCKQPFFLSLPAPVQSAKKVGSAHRPHVLFATLSSLSLWRSAGLWRGAMVLPSLLCTVADKKRNCKWRYQSPWAFLSETFYHDSLSFLRTELYTTPRNDCTLWMQSNPY